MSAQRKGRSVLGAFAGFFFGLFLGLTLLTSGVLPLESIVLLALPVLGLIVGIIWGRLGLLGKAPQA